MAYLSLRRVMTAVHLYSNRFIGTLLIIIFLFLGFSLSANNFNGNSSFGKNLFNEVKSHLFKNLKDRLTPNELAKLESSLYLKEEQPASFLSSSLSGIDTSLLKHYANDLYFEENIGQLNKEILYKVDAPQYSIRFLKDRVSIATLDNKGLMGHVWNMKFENISSKVQIQGEKSKKTRVGYLGDDFMTTPNFEEVWYKGIYPNVDLRFYSKGDGTVEYDFVVYKGGEVSDIKVSLEGIETYQFTNLGEISMCTPLGEMRTGKPYTYQMINGKEEEIASKYISSTKGFAFEVPNYDENETLIIDPTTLLASTIFGTNDAYAKDIFVNDNGIYITGQKRNNDDLPTTPGVIGPDRIGDLSDRLGYVALISHDMTTLSWVTYIRAQGNTDWNFPENISVDDAGKIYVYGGAGNSGLIPTTPNSIQPVAPNNSQKAMVLKINEDATVLEYGTYLGGTTGLTLGLYGDLHNGLVYLTGYTSAPDLPTTTGAYIETNPTSDFVRFLAIVNPDPNITDGSDLVYLTYISADETNYPGTGVITYDLRVDPITEKIYLIGATNNPDFYTTNDALYSFEDAGGTYDMFLMEFQPVASLGNGLSDVTYSTGLGGKNITEFGGVMMIDGNDLYFGVRVIKTNSTDENNLPMVGNSHSALLSSQDSYIARFNLTTKQIEASSYLGATTSGGISWVSDFEKDPNGDIWVSGYSGNEIVMPSDAYQSIHPGNNTPFLMRFDNNFSTLKQGTFLGTDGAENPSRSLEYYDGALYFTGSLNAAAATSGFPTTPGVLYPTHIMDEHQFVSAFSNLMIEKSGVPDTVCANQNFTVDIFNVTGGQTPYTFTWTAIDPNNVNSITNETTSTPTLNLSDTQSFLVQVTDSLGAIDIETVTFEIIPSAASLDLGNDHHICSGQNQEIGVHNYEQTTYAWTVVSGDVNALNTVDPSAGIIEVSPSSSTAFRLVYTDCASTMLDDTITVYVDHTPAAFINAGVDTSVCIAGSFQMGAPSMEIENFSYNWSPSTNLDDASIARPTISNFQVEDVGLYYVTMTNQCTGATAIDEILLELNTSSANARADTAGCSGVPLPISSRANVLYTSYAWTFASTGTNTDGGVGGTITNDLTDAPTITITSAGAHQIVLTTNSVSCGVTTDTMEVVISQLPTAEAGLDQDVCVDYPNNLNTYVTAMVGTPALLDFTYLWTREDAQAFNAGEIDDATLPEPTINPNNWGAFDTVSYVVAVTNSCGQVERDTVQLSKYQNIPGADAYQPDGTPGANSLTIGCGNSWPIGMDAEAGVIYSWSPTTNLAPYTALYTDINNAAVIATNILDTVVYTLTAVDTCSGNSATSSVTIMPVCGDGGISPPPFAFNSLPAADAGLDVVSYCDGDSTQIGTPDPSNGVWTYSWYPTTDLSDPNIPQPIASPTSPRSYTLTVTNPNTGVSASDIILVEVLSAPIVDAGPDITALCASDINAVLGPPTGEAGAIYENDAWQYEWIPSTGLDDPNALRPNLVGPDIETVYTLYVTDSETGCQSSAFITVNVTATTADAGPDGTICPGESLQLGTPAVAGLIYEWTPVLNISNSSAAQPTVSPDSSVTYSLRVTDMTGCVDISEVFVNVTTSESLPADVGSDQMGVCTTDADFSIGVNVDETPAATYLWTSNPAGGTAALSSTTVAQPTVSPASLTAGTDYTFYLQVTDVGSSCISSDSLVIGVVPNTAPVITASPTTITGCPGDLVSGSGISVSPTSDDYIITWSSATDPDLNFMSPSSALTPNFVVQTSVQTYQIMVENSCTGASDTETIMISPTSPPEITDMGTYAEVCPGTVVNLNATTSGVTTFTWSIVSGSGTFSSTSIEDPTFTPDEPSTLKLEVDNGACTITDYVNIPVESPPANAGIDQTICVGDNVTIGNPGNVTLYDYTWSVISGDAGSIIGSNTIPQIEVSPNTNTMYEVSVEPTGGGACTAKKDTVEVFLGATPAVADAGSDITICPDTLLILGPASTNSEFTYSWSPATGLSNPFIANPQANTTTTTTYTLTVTDCSGGMAMDNVTITVNPGPFVNAGSDVTICEGETIQLGSTDAGHTYSWLPTEGLSDPSSATPTVSVPSDITSSYSVTYTLTADDGSCTSSDQVTVTFAPQPALSYDAVNLCPGDPGVTLGNASSISGIDLNTATIVWLPNENIDDNRIANPTVNPTANTIYTVTVSTPDGCSASTPVVVTVSSPELLVSATEACSVANGGGTGTVSVGEITGATYSWTGPNGFMSTDAVNNLTNLSAADFGMYYVNVTTPENCVLMDSVELVEICALNAACDINIDTVFLASCDYVNNTAEITVTVSWGVGSPTGEMIEVYAGGNSATIDATTLSSPQSVNITTPLGQTGTVLARFATSTSCQDGDDWAAPNLTITTTYSDNCQEPSANNFTADWNIGVNAYSLSDQDISYQRNSDAVQMITMSGTTDTLSIPNIPADGNMGDTIKVWFTNAPTCGDTLILKRPVPCPTNLGSDAGEICSSISNSEIKGTVFEDWNYDGIMNQNDTVGIQGIQVNIYDCNAGANGEGTLLGTTYTDANGNYAFDAANTAPDISSGTTYRVEFILPEAISCWATPTLAGADNGTTVQFVQTGSCASLGLSNAGFYCQNVPSLVTSCFIFGDQSTNDPSIVAFPDTASGAASIYNTYLATVAQTGNTWGLTFDHNSQTLYAAAATRRHAGFGSGGTGAIYKVDYDAASPAGTLFLDLNALLGAETTGTNPHPTGTDFFYDSESWDAVGKIGLGDIDVSDDGTMLYTVNLAKRQLMEIPVGANVTPPSSASEVGQYDIPCPCVDQNDMRPWAVTYHKGEVYVGLICSGESTVDTAYLSARPELDVSTYNDNSGGPLSYPSSEYGDPNSLYAYVYKFDLINKSFVNAPVMEAPLNFPRGVLIGSPWQVLGQWRPWVPQFTVEVFSQGGQVRNVAWPQPVLTNIEFDNEDMILGFMDRAGSQYGALAGSVDDGGANSQVDTFLYVGYVAGDILRACKSGENLWEMERNGSCGGVTTAGAGNLNGPLQDPSLPYNAATNPSGEFYYQENYTVAHQELGVGGLTVLPGTGEVVSTVYDPINGGQAFTSGAIWLSNTTGVRNQEYLILTGGFGKANSLGDIEPLCEEPPIEIGNYVWEDLDGDGIQDACEPGIEGVRMELYSSTGTLLAFDTTDANGQYYFSHSDSTDQYWVVNPDSLEANTMYYILAGQGQFSADLLTIGGNTYNITIDSADGGANRYVIDSDSEVGSGFSGGLTVLNGFPNTKITTGNWGIVDHSFDFGFYPCPTITASSADTTVCSGIMVNSIEVNTNATATDAISFVYFSSQQTGTDMYSGGTLLGTATPSGGAASISAVSFPANGGATPVVYYVYAILNPTPAVTTCRPYVEILVTINPLPTPSLSNITVCPGATSTLDPGMFTSYAWSNSATTQTITVGQGTYTVTVTDANGCTATASATISEHAAPTPSLSNVTVCPGATSTLDPGVFTSYAWSNSATTQTITVGQGTYTVTVTDANGCTATALATISEHAAPTPSLSDVTVCPGATSTLDPGMFTSYAWSNSATTQTITVGQGTYTVTVTDSNGCTATATATISEHAAPTPSLSDVTVCPGATSTLDPGVFTSYAWSNSATTQTITVGQGTYTVTVTDANGCTATASVTISEHAAPMPSLSNATVCPGATSTLDPGMFTSYAWSNSATTQTITVGQGNYTVTVTDANGCTATASATISEHAAPTPSLSNVTVCPGATLTLDPGMFTSYAWSNSATTRTITVGQGTYTVTVTDSNGCTATASATISEHAAPTPSLSDVTVCPGGTSTLDPGMFTSYAWSNSATTQTITVGQGTYTVTVTDANGCTATASATISEHAAPTPSLSDVTVCSGGTSTLDPGMFTSYAWSNSATTQTITVGQGTYTVTVTDANGCTATASATISEHAAPTPSLSDVTVCPGGTSTLDPGMFTSYAWSNSATTQTITVGQGTYTVTVTDSNGCTATATATVSEHAAPTPSLSNVTVCPGATSTLDPGMFTSYAWSNSATTQTITVGQGTYTVTVTDVNGCTATASATISEHAAPTPSLSNVTVCPGATSTLDPGMFTSYAWSNSATTQTITVGQGTYTVTVTNANGCTATASATISEHAAPTPSLSDVTVCPGATSTLDPGMFNSYAWSNSATTQTITVGQGAYTVTVTDANGCTATASAMISEHAAPTPSLSNITVCPGATSTLDPGVFISYAWSNSATTQTITVGQGTYTVTVTDANGCTATASAIISEHTAPSCSITGSNMIVENTQDVSYSGPGGMTTYSWSVTAGDASIDGASNIQNVTVDFGTVNSTLELTITDANGCSSTCSINITMTSSLTCSISGPTSTCVNTSGLVFTGTAGASTYSWSITSGDATINGSSTNQTVTVDAASMDFTIELTISPGVSTTCSEMITVNALPTPSLSNVTVCPGATLTLDPGMFTSYAWSNSATTRTITVGQGTYTVTVTDSNGCTATASATISEHAAPMPSLSNVTVCPGATSTLDPGMFTSYAWSNSATTQTITVGQGTYTVTVTDSNGCTATASATISEHAAPTPSLSDVTVCPGATSTLDPGMFTSYAWSNSATTQTITVGQGTYTVTVTDANGCTATASATISEHAAPTPSLSNIMVCPGATSTLDPGMFTSYAWSNSATTQMITVGQGTYTVTVTDANGCTATASATISEHAAPTPSLSNVTVCPGATSTLDPGVFTSYAWSNSATTQTITVGQGTYTVTVTDSNGCTATASATISEHAAPTPSLSNVTVCPGATSTLDPGMFTSYAWSNSATTQTITVGQGTYTVTVTDANGCTATASATISEHVAPTPSLSNVTVCPGATSTLDPGMFTSYAWSNSATTQTITVGQGTFTVTVTDANGCTATSTATISEHAAPTPSLSNVTVCPGATSTLDPGMFTSYVWSNSATTQTITVGQGTYTVTVTDANGCTAIASATISEHAAPTPSLSNVTVCPGATSTLDPGMFTSYAWSNSATTQTITVGQGTYTVTVTDANGCTATASATISEHAAPTPSLSNVTVCPGVTSMLDPGMFTSYAWSNSATTQTITVGQGTYTVTVTDANGCTATASSTISEHAAPTPSLSNVTVCPGATTTLDPGMFTSYAWSNSATTQTITVGQGTYMVTVTDANGCTATATATISEHTAPSCSITGSTTIVENTQDVSYSGPVGMTTYSWSVTSGDAVIDGANNTQNVTIDFGTVNSTLELTVTDGNGCTATCSVNITIIPASMIDLSLSKSVDNSVANIGENVTFTIIVQNDGPDDATGVQVTDQLPSGLDYVSDSGMGAYVANVWTIGNLANGESDTLTITATVLATGIYQNDAAITAANETDVDSDPSSDNMTDDLGDMMADDDEDAATVTPNLNFDLSLDKHLATGQNDTIDLGEDITYTIVVTNEGDIPALNTQICDIIPAGLILSPLDMNSWTGTSPDTVYHVIPGPINPGESDSINIVLRLVYGASGANLVNVAEIVDDMDADGNGVVDSDSTPNNGNVSEDDLEGEGVTLLDHDPTGYIYCDKTGIVVTGGTISVTGPSGIPDDPTEVAIVQDGSTGYYEWYAIGPIGTYSITYNHPNGHALSAVKTPTAPLYNIPTGPPNITLGSDTTGMYLTDTTFANNPYYLNFGIEPGDAFVFLNNIPVSCVFIGSIVCNDDDENDIDDGNEPGFPNVIVRLYNCADTINPIDTTLTDANGFYRFDGLSAGDYRVQFVTPAGYQLISANDTLGLNGFASCVTLNLAECDTTKSVCYTPIPYDYGDLPDISVITAANDYQTTIANGGPVHRIIDGLILGATVDKESDGQPTTAADGDGADEDGFTFPITLSLNPGVTIRRPLVVTNTTGTTAHLEAWIDWNGDGDFDDTGEMVLDISDDGAGDFGASQISITVPNDATQNRPLGVRFRLSNTDNMTPYGQVESGEVEDYLISIGCPLNQCLPVNVNVIRP